MPKPAWWQGRARWLLLCAVLGLVATSGLVLGLPPLLKHLVETRGSALLGRDVRLDAAEVSLWRLTLTLHGLRVAGAGADADARPQLEVRRLHADLEDAAHPDGGDGGWDRVEGVLLVGLVVPAVLLALVATQGVAGAEGAGALAAGDALAEAVAAVAVHIQ